MAIKQIDAKIEKIEELSPTVKHFIINLNDNIEMKAGQFVNLSFEENNETCKRPYSIASSPSFNQKTGKIELCIKLVENGFFTPKLWNKKENDIVHIMGPLGIFTLEKSNPEKKLVFIGTGTGIAPLRSMIKEELEKQANQEKIDNIESEAVTINREIMLIFGVRHENEILYREEFEKLEKENPNFKYLEIVSRPEKTWIGRTGHVQDNFESIDPLNSQVYMCGLPQMVEGAKQKLLEMGLQESDIHNEIYK